MSSTTKHDPLPRRRTRASGFSRASSFILCAFLAIFALPVSAETDEECIAIQEDVELQLSWKMKRSDKIDLAARRSYLNDLFAHTSRACATMLLYRLKNTKQDDLTLYELFHYKLAPATQEELLDILKARFRAGASTRDIVEEGAPGDGTPGRVSHAGTESDMAVSELRETDIHCMQVQYDLTMELSKKYTRPDNKGLYQRRKRLNKLVENTTPSCAKTLKKRLGEKRNGSELSELFHYKLAAPTRKELLAVLDERSRAQASVIEGDIEIGITPEQVKAAAKRATRILATIHPTNDNFGWLDRLECIVAGIEANPGHFDDSYFPVAPEGVNIEQTDNPWTCYKKPYSLTSEPTCREGESVVDHCRKSFSQKLVNAVIAGDSDEELLDLMLIMEDDINRGLTYFSSMRNIAGHLGGSENKNAMMCQSAAEHLVPRMSSSNSQDRLYNCYPDP